MWKRNTQTHAHAKKRMQKGQIENDERKINNKWRKNDERSEWKTILQGIMRIQNTCTQNKIMKIDNKK